MGKTRKPGGGRKKLKPEFDAGKNLKEQMERELMGSDPIKKKETSLKNL